MLFQKQRKKAFTLFVGCALGFMVFLLFWSSFFNHLFADKLVSGTSAVESLFSFGRYPEQVGIFVGQLFVGEPIAFVLIIIAFVGWFIGCILLRRSLSIVAKRRVSLVAFVIALPVALSIVVVAVISPVNAVRYVYNIAPFISCLAAVAVVYVVRLWAGKYTTEQVRDFSGAGLSTISFTSAYSDKIDDEMQSRTIVLVLSVVIIVSLIATAICTAKVTPSYTHREFPQFDAKIEPYLDSPCLYVNDGYSAPITTDILQLAQFQNVFVSNLEDMSLVADYVDTHAASDQLVVYMTINDFWTKAYDPSEVVSKLKEQFGYTEAVKLYRFGLSESYVLTK